MTAHSYSAGLHKLLTLSVQENDKLVSADAFLDFTRSVLRQFELEEVGVSSHVFDNGSFTMAVCLKESHICIHTWPEFSQLTLDVYLCNYLQDNSQKVREVASAYVGYFSAQVVNENEIWR
ncbi:S-adenosylmethionine decarboxylase family protein [Flavobacterium sp.]|uniref:S-adenosylmethionine decarboxylase family protein n=1 Tax=Flavobacterium sp. TaxID=239 RepID=UPI0012243CA9|nr:S-adenosylmethionine decarboxylase [Flavobacterium sp.]RZJ69336.1 MAG: adenosylmethionine decarboxylase [Flavobacterium sp.]